MPDGTVTYVCPASVRGGSTPPLSSQVCNCVIADVQFSGAQNTATVVHNLSGVSSDGLDGSPMVEVLPLLLAAGAKGVTVSFVSGGVVLTVISLAFVQKYRIWIWRHSLITDFTI